jgi:hypothetical protein
MLCYKSTSCISYGAIIVVCHLRNTIPINFSQPIWIRFYAIYAKPNLILRMNLRNTYGSGMTSPPSRYMHYSFLLKAGFEPIKIAK